MKNAALSNSLRCAMALMLFCVGLYAQNSSMNGTVSDPTGAVVPNASLTLVNTQNGTQRSVLSDPQGRFTFDGVMPGVYRLQAKAAGFSEIELDKIEILVNQPVTIPVKFEKVGSTSETISVEAGTVLVNTVDATLGNAIDSHQIIELPSFARNVASLLTFQPGVNQSGNVNGGKSDQGNITLDGADVNNQSTRAAMSSVLNVTMDSVEEFRVTTTNGNADQGRTSGAQITLVTKSGTNQLHGSLYEYRRGTETAANDYLNNASNLPKPALLINIFGGTAGGPIKKNKFFGFINYEGRRDASANSALRTVPTAAGDAGNVLYKSTSGSIVTLSPAQIQANVDGAHIGVSPAVMSLFKLYPQGNDVTTGDLLNTMGYRFNSPAHNVQNTYISRFDWAVDNSGKHMVFFRGQLQDYWKNNSPQFPDQPPASVSLDNSKGIAIGYTASLKPTLVSTMRYGFTRYGNETTGVLNGNYSYFRNISTIYPTTTDGVRLIPVHSVSEDIAWTRGSHDFHFGGVMRFISNYSSTLAGTFSDAYGNASWMLNTGKELQPSDLASSFRTSETYAMITLLGLLPEGDAHYNYDLKGSALGAGVPVVRDFKNNEYEWYVSDTWRVTRNFTVTAGVRHSIMPPVHEANGYQTSSIPGLDEWLGQRGYLASQGLPQSLATPVQFDLSSKTGKGLYPNHLKNFAPRLSLAYSPHAGSGLSKFLFGGEGKTSIRAGFGMFYDLIGQPLAVSYSGSALGFSTSLSNPAGVQSSVTSPRFTGFYNIPSGLLPAAPPGGFPQTQPNIFQITNSIDPSLQNPYTMNLDFSIGREFGHGWFVQGSYVGRLSRRSLAHRDVAEPTNLVDPKSGQTYFQAAQLLATQGNAGVATAAVAKIPFWENMFPGLAVKGLTATQEAYNIYNNYAPDYTSALVQIDQACSPSCSIYGPYALFNSQYSALSTFSSVGMGAYHAMEWTARKRMGTSLTLDFNYTFSKSEDLASTTEAANGTYSGLIQNAWFPHQEWAVSDYDARHLISTFAVWQVPVGRNRALLSNAHGVVDAILGGWMLTPTLQWSSYLPTSVGDGANWATDWELTTSADQIAPVSTNITKNAPAITGKGGANLFSDPNTAFAAFQFALPGESGTRNELRRPGPFSINLSLAKEFTIHENHKLQFRWESFNLTNTAVFNAFSLDLGTASTFGKATGDAGPRQMQFAMRYSF